MDIGLMPSPTPLELRYTELERPVLLTGIQALVRLLLEQARRDRAAGHHTAGLVSGYRGSPLAGLDLELWHEQKMLDAFGIRFQPGLNEDLAATILWGSQQLDAFSGKKVDGVFGMWYGKGPGVDRSGDPFRCANTLGTAPLGGVLAVSGDDHGAHSSVFPHQTEHIFEAAMMPILVPTDVADILDLGLAGFALSRFAGTWVALKTTSETAEQAGTVIVPAERSFTIPEIALPPHGLNYDPNLKFPGNRIELERRIVEERLPAVAAWVRANRLDRVVFGPARAPYGIITVGKAHTDVLHALRRLGLEKDPRIAIYKVALSWPLETQALREFAQGKRLLFVVEEKRSFVEQQVRAALYDLPTDSRPAIAGKSDLAGAPLLSPLLELSPEQVGRAIVRMLRSFGEETPDFPAPPHAEHPAGLLKRAPAFCAGCPHSTSTRLPSGSHAMAGIGCHVMRMQEDENTRTFSQMGGEGVAWVGMAPFTETSHMFANIGDGTYEHSGILAIRQAVAANATMTYKILFNGAVAMTGGQPIEGGLTVPKIAAQVAAEGVQRIAVVADDPGRLPPCSLLPPGTTRHGRDQLDQVQRDLRAHPGVSVLIYDQVCATEKRRRRKRGKLPEPSRHPVINETVCENCGDCSVQSGCIAIEPVQTELGRKRRINPTSCNVDLSCLKGFCPSFVMVDGPPQARSAHSRWEDREQELAAGLTEPVLPDSDVWRGLFAGIGGGGIVTAAAVLCEAAHLEGRGVRGLNFTGLAQKNGAVVSHVQIGMPNKLDVVRIPLGEADLMLAADLAVSAGPGVLERCRSNAAVVGNIDLIATSAFKHDPWLSIDAGLHRRAIEAATAKDRSVYLQAVALSERLFGNAQALNTLLLGIAWQRGLIPVGRAAILRAIELNGAAIAMNTRAFLWGRILAANPDLAHSIVEGHDRAAPPDLSHVIENRAAFLVLYQNQAYADLYRSRVARAAAREAQAFGRAGRFTPAAAEGWFRVMTYKDEYEVARLHAAAKYGANPLFSMAPPLITRTDPASGRRRKITIPGWIGVPLFRLLRHGKALRGTKLDPFGWQEDRRTERSMIAEYESDMQHAIQALAPDTLEPALSLASWPDAVRGYGAIKLANYRRVQATRQAALAKLEQQLNRRAA